MTVSRRELAALLSVMAPAEAQSALPTRVYLWEDLPVRVNGQNRSRAILDGTTSTSFPIEIHETELAPGLAPHGSHSHINDEILIVREGTLESIINGQTATLTPGSLVYISAGEKHGFRNAGATRARYYILALGPKK
ncbi:MAG TPA: cupin domain-containing protein [Bryobacteraceae bacterium]|nr:cupin domain-containing protein [Bryobacteraceae bacterium]